MKHVKVIIKSTGLNGHVMHCDSIDRDKSYIVRVKGNSYHSLGLLKGSQLEIVGKKRFENHVAQISLF